MLTQPHYAEFIEWYGKQAIQAPKAVQSILGRLFWFTIEFGLMQTEQGLKIYGGGILSSLTETQYALENEHPQRCKFDLAQVLQTDYRYDEIQKKYFVIQGLQELFLLKSQPILALAALVKKQPDHDFVLC